MDSMLTMCDNFYFTAHVTNILLFTLFFVLFSYHIKEIIIVLHFIKIFLTKENNWFDYHFYPLMLSKWIETKSQVSTFCFMDSFLPFWFFRVAMSEGDFACSTFSPLCDSFNTMFKILYWCTKNTLQIVLCQYRAM